MTTAAGGQETTVLSFRPQKMCPELKPPKAFTSEQLLAPGQMW